MLIPEGEFAPLTTAQAAAVAGVRPGTIRAWRARGILPSYRDAELGHMHYKRDVWDAARRADRAAYTPASRVA